jgi:hypothetical protein
MSARRSTSTPRTYGLLAEFDSPAALITAAEQVTAGGYTRTDAFSPFPIHGLADAIGFRENKVAPIILGGGITGLLGGFGLQYYCQVVAYPMNIGGRPTYSWVAWIPPTFEMTILFAAFAAVIGMFALNGLPQPYHPVFNAPRFALASQERFFLVIEATDPKFDPDRTRAFLAGLNPREVVAVDE